jgi:tripartite-type tricarboxylate transporter receptor subunit TctC
METFLRSLLFAITFCLCALSSAVTAAEWTPTKSIRFIVPYAPGAFGDVSARVVAEKISASLGQPIVIENKAGAAGAIGTEAGAKAPPDGYTWTLGADPGITIGPNMQKVAYDPFRDFVAAGLIATTPMALIVNASLPANSLEELITLAKTRPGTLTMGSAGNGTPPHLELEMFRAAGIDIVHVPYKGQAQAVTDLLGGRIDMTISTLPSADQYLKAGRVKALAISAAERAAALPNVPTFREAGYPNFEIRTWVGILLPAGTPPDVVARVQKELANALAQPDVKTRFAGLAYEPADPNPVSMRDLMASNNAKFGKLIRDANIKPD